MNIAEELLDVFEKMHALSIDDELERLGIRDHDGLRLFGQIYGVVVADVEKVDGVAASMEEALGASVIAGFLLGLDYAQRHSEVEV